MQNNVDLNKDHDNNVHTIPIPSQSNLVEDSVEIVKAQPPTTIPEMNHFNNDNLRTSETILLGPLQFVDDADKVVGDVLKKQRKSRSLTSSPRLEGHSTTPKTPHNSPSVENVDIHPRKKRHNPFHHENLSEKETNEHEKTKEKRSFLRRTFFSQHTEDAFKQVWEIYEIFTKDLNMTTFQLLSTLQLCFVYYKDNAIHSEAFVSPSKDLATVETINHYAKYAISIFGWALQELRRLDASLSSARGIFDGFWSGDKLDRQIICKHTGIEDKDVIYVSLKSEYFRPGYFIAVDHVHKAIVCCVRGTFAIRDALTDLVAQTDRFKGGLSSYF
jgi:hypothetical protein